MKRIWAVVAAATVVVAVGGCSKGTESSPPSTADATSSVASTSTEPQSKAGPSANLPDPCKLLSGSEVTDLTGRAVTQTDEDGAEPGASSRYCQWQLESGQLAVFLQRTTAGDFATANSAAEGAVPVAGVGDAAYSASGHLYVLSGSVEIDAYVRGGSAEQNLADAKAVAAVLIPKIQG